MGRWSVRPAYYDMYPMESPFAGLALPEADYIILAQAMQLLSVQAGSLLAQRIA